MENIMTIYKKRALISVAVTIGIVIMFIAVFAYISNRIKTANQAQVVGQACQPFNVSCKINPPQGTDSRDYLFDIYVTDNSSLSFIWGSVNDFSPNEPGGFTVEVPVNSLIQSTQSQNFSLQCNATVKKKGQEGSCKNTFNSSPENGQVCQQQQCPDCACLEKNEIQIIGQSRAIKYVPLNPSPTPNACYGECVAVFVKQYSTGKQIRNEMCKDEVWIGEGGTNSDQCQNYAFSKERLTNDGLVVTCTGELPGRSSNESCDQQVCCSTSYDEACKLADDLNDVNGDKQCPDECNFKLSAEPHDINDKPCPLCNNKGGLVGHINQRILATLTASTSVAGWKNRTIYWGTFDNDFTDVSDTVQGGKLYIKGGVYKLKLECKKDNEKLTCEKYLPVICASCGGDSPSPSPSKSPSVTPGTSPSPTPPFCPVTERINLEFKLECLNCGASPTLTQSP